MKARLESLGILNSVSKLREISTPTKKERPYVKRVYGLTPLRRSQRIKGVTDATAAANLPQRRSSRLKSSFSYNVTPKQGSKINSTLFNFILTIFIGFVEIYVLTGLI